MDTRGVGAMTSSEAIFLSAGVPDARRGPDYAKTADSVAIAAAVSALVHVVLGRRLLVWGGHPSITPMVWVVAESMGVDYGQWVKLYQSTFFGDEYPEDNERFQNVVYVEDVPGDREGSLLAMRKRMFATHRFGAAVFIGGMGGIVDEFNLFRAEHPVARALPIASTGGAAATLTARLATASRDLTDELDYVRLFHDHLGVSVKEERYKRPEEQPLEMEKRMWRSSE